MELKDFVKETLTQISQGVQESIAEVRDAGGYVNPATRTNTKNTDSAHFGSMPNGQNIFLVDFDVAVSVEEDMGGNAEAKLKVASVLSIGGGAETSTKNSATNQISFKVPIAIPVDPISENDLKERESAQARRTQQMIDNLNNSRRYP